MSGPGTNQEKRVPSRLMAGGASCRRTRPGCHVALTPALSRRERGKAVAAADGRSACTLRVADQECDRQGPEQLGQGQPATLALVPDLDGGVGQQVAPAAG